MCDLWLKQVKKPNCTRPYCEPQIHTGKASYGYKLFGCVRLDGFRFCDKMRNPWTNSKKKHSSSRWISIKKSFLQISWIPFLTILLGNCKNVFLYSGLFLLTMCIPAFAVALFLRAVFQILFPDFPPNGMKICFGISCFIATPKSGFQNFPIERTLWVC